MTNINLADIVALIGAIVTILSFVIGLPAALWYARKQFREAKTLLATEAKSYSEAAQNAVESQASLQGQINELRDELKRRDAEISKRDTRILNLEDEIKCLYAGQADKDRQIQQLETLTQAQAKEISELRAEVEELRKK